MYNNKFSNTVLGFLNLVSLLASIPVIGAGLWMGRSNTTCESFLRTPLLVVGFVILIISLVGFLGACFQVSRLLWVYLLVMLLIVVALMSITLFGYVITSQGSGVDLVGRIYKEYHIDKYSPWLRRRVEDRHYWMRIRSCILGSNTCAQIMSWSPFDYLTKPMSPVQSGCCKPPTSCDYSETTRVQDPDCYRWNNDPNILCYDCDSCRAGVLENFRSDWHKISVVNIMMVLLLTVIFVLGCCAFQNIRRSEMDYPYGHHRCPRSDPMWF
ncbi:hypothetical protein Leryth_007589 [Lithospermum erythrorhizon]|nr:hypothetical protein Leryth_007589 [Lithospermum erythrorhizon]